MLCLYLPAPRFSRYLLVTMLFRHGVTCKARVGQDVVAVGLYIRRDEDLGRFQAVLLSSCVKKWSAVPVIGGVQACSHRIRTSTVREADAEAAQNNTCI